MIFVGINRILGVHFRGGSFSWAPVSKVSALTINVSITQSYSWIRSAEFCDSTTISAQGLIGTNTTSLQCGRSFILESI